MLEQIKLLSVVLIACSLLWSGAVYAEGPGPDHKGKGKEFAEKMEAKKQEFYKELNLTDEQKKALEENKNKHRKEAKVIKEDVQAKRSLMRQELQKEQLDMNKINQIQSELKASEAKMIDQRLDGVLEVRKILTPEQFEKFSDRMEKKKGQAWDKKGPGPDSKEGHLQGVHGDVPPPPEQAGQ